MKSDAALFEAGLDLFNRGLFFECHEAWEALWLREEGAEKLFVQGLIQAAVAILHAERGNFDGAAKLYEKAREKLDVVGADHRGIDIRALRRSLNVFFDSALTSHDSAALPARPRIRRTAA